MIFKFFFYLYFIIYLGLYESSIVVVVVVIVSNKSNGKEMDIISWPTKLVTYMNTSISVIFLIFYENFLTMNLSEFAILFAD